MHLPVATVARGNRVGVVVRRIGPDTLVTRFRTRSVRRRGRIVSQLTQLTKVLLLVFELEVTQTVRTDAAVAELSGTRREIRYS